jgi:hypothetical protein
MEHGMSSDPFERLDKARQIAHHLLIVTDDLLRYAAGSDTSMLGAKLTDFFGSIQTHHPDDAAGAWNVLADANQSDTVNRYGIEAESLAEWVVQWNMNVAAAVLDAADVSRKQLSAHITMDNNKTVRRHAWMGEKELRSLKAAWPKICRVLAQQFPDRPDVQKTQIEIDQEHRAATRHLRKQRPILRDESTEARDAWIYDQCCKGVAYTTIISTLRKDHKDWAQIKSKQGITDAAKRYAQRHTKPLPPRRQKR